MKDVYSAYFVLAFCLVANTNSKAQTFEGTLTYSITFGLDSFLFDKNDKWFESGKYEKKYKEKMYNEQAEYTIKEDRYVRTGFLKEEDSFIYDAADTALYKFIAKSEKKSDAKVEVIDAFRRFETNQATTGARIKPTWYLVDSIRIINGIECKLVLLDFGELFGTYWGREEFWYNADTLKLDPANFEGHNYEYLAPVFALTKAWPIEMVRMTGEYCLLKLTLVSARSEKISDSAFELPKLKPYNWPEKEFGVYIERIGHKRVMIIDE